jgi:hypothetical protein
MAVEASGTVLPRHTTFSRTPAQVQVHSETRVKVSSSEWDRGVPNDRDRDCDVLRIPTRNTLPSLSSSDSLAVCIPTCGDGASCPLGASFCLWTVMSMGLVRLRPSDSEVGGFNWVFGSRRTGIITVRLLVRLLFLLDE